MVAGSDLNLLEVRKMIESAAARADHLVRIESECARIEDAESTCLPNA